MSDHVNYVVLTDIHVMSAQAEHGQVIDVHIRTCIMYHIRSWKFFMFGDSL